MNKLYIRIHANHVVAWPDGVLVYALCSKDGAILREGRATLAELSKDIFKAKVVLLIAASDVTLLEITIPAIPEAKLKLALPNLVEDQLMSDSADCVLLLGAKRAPSDQSPLIDANKRIVAVAQRNWIQQLSASLYSLGATHVKALPAQLCLPYTNGQCSVFIEDNEQLSTLYSLRSDVDKGIGILLESEQSLEKRLSIISQLSMQSSGAVLLQLPKELMGEYKAVIDANPVWKDRFVIQEFTWSATIEAANTVSFNLMAGLNSAQKSRTQWRMWRWTLMLGALTLLVNLIGLNVEYWGLKREAQTLKMGIAQTYKASFPKDTVVPFPLDQMKKNLQIAKRNAGQASANDFTVLLSGLGSAWSSVGANSLPKIVSIEYKDHALLLQIDGDMPQAELKKALSFKSLDLKKNNAEIWQVKEAE